MASRIWWLGNYKNWSDHFSHSGKVVEQNERGLSSLKVGWKSFEIVCLFDVNCILCVYVLMCMAFNWRTFLRLRFLPTVWVKWHSVLERVQENFGVHPENYSQWLKTKILPGTVVKTCMRTWSSVNDAEQDLGSHSYLVHIVILPIPPPVH